MVLLYTGTVEWQYVGVVVHVALYVQHNEIIPGRYKGTLYQA